jgi:hypothetical protein
MKTYFIGFVNNSSQIYAVKATTAENAKIKFCSFINTHYPNSYIKQFKSSIGRQVVDTI